MHHLKQFSLFDDVVVYLFDSRNFRVVFAWLNALITSHFG